MTLFFRTFYIITFCFISISSFGQYKYEYEGFNWGFKLGLAGNTFKSDVGPWSDSNAIKITGNSDPFKRSTNLGVHFGGFVGFDFYEFLGVQADLQFSSKGEDYQRTSKWVTTFYENGLTRDESENIVYQLKYIELPLAIRITPIERVSIKFGIVPGFNVYSKIKYNYWVPDDDTNINIEPFEHLLPNGDFEPVKEEFEKSDFDNACIVILSGQAEIHYNTKRGYFYVSFNRSFTNIFNVDEINAYNYQTKDSSVGIGFAYRIFAY